MVVPKKDAKAVKDSKAPKAPKAPKASKASKASKAAKASKAPKAAKASKAPKAAKAAKAAKAPKAPKASKAAKKNTVSKKSLSTKLPSKSVKKEKKPAVKSQVKFNNEENVETKNLDVKNLDTQNLDIQNLDNTHIDTSTDDLPVADKNQNAINLPAYSEDELLEKNAQFYQLYWRWSDFSLKIVEPNNFNEISPPNIIMPDNIDGSSDVEHVYPIHDFGNMLSTSKGDDMYESGMSMCKLYFTIEKMVYLLIEKLKSGGIDEATNVQIEFDGHELVQRKAFESVINLSYNVVVTNFDPGTWGDRYLNMVKRVGEKGYGYPLKSPRVDVYHRSYSSGTTVKTPS